MVAGELSESRPVNYRNDGRSESESALPDNAPGSLRSAPASPERLRNFYGRSKELRVKYVRERKRLDYGMAHEDEYALEMLEETR